MKSKTRFWRVVGIAFLLPVFFAILDNIGAAMWRAATGGFNSTAYIQGEAKYMILFWTFAYAIITLIALIYYITTKDKSESLALFIIPIILLQMGAEDVFFYFIGGIQLWTAQLPWLTENLWVPTFISWAFGEEIITGPVILLSAFIGYLASYIVARQLVKIKG